MNFLAYLWCRWVSGHRDVRVVRVYYSDGIVMYCCRSCGDVWLEEEVIRAEKKGESPEASAVSREVAKEG
jgi:hypothetical protein